MDKKYSDITTDYNHFAKTFSDSRKKMKWPEIDYILENYLEGKKHILDIGCGNGRLLQHIYDFEGSDSLSYLGVDMSEEMIKEAKKIFPKKDFSVVDMLDIDKIDGKFDLVFFVASFHHLDNIEKRKNVLKGLFPLLEDDTVVVFINWALESEKNKDRFVKQKIPHSENSFGSSDFSIKIGEFQRYYHSFSLQELDYLFRETGYDVLENRVFDGKRNIISVIQKTNLQG